MIDGFKSLTNLSIPQRAIRALIIKLFQAKILVGGQLMKSDKFGQALPRASKQKALEIIKDKNKKIRKYSPTNFTSHLKSLNSLRIIKFPSKDNIWNADLVIMPPENGFKHTLTILDGYTRYAWVIPLKHKDGLSVSNAFKAIMKKSNRKPNKLWVDQGKEFYNEHMYKLFKFKKEDTLEKDKNGEYKNQIYSVFMHLKIL